MFALFFSCSLKNVVFSEIDDLWSTLIPELRTIVIQYCSVRDLGKACIAGMITLEVSRGGDSTVLPRIIAAYMDL